MPLTAYKLEKAENIFLQVQQWLGNDLDPLEFGWQIGEGGDFVPKQGFSSICPPQLMKLMGCKCTKNCTSKCGCRRLGLQCGEDCECSENICENRDENVEDLELDDFDEQ